jgi:hypothetical protein
LNLLLTAAGAGSRFRQEGISTPKPLIRVQGKELLLHALASFGLAHGDRLLLGVQRQHRVRQQLEQALAEKLPDVSVSWVELEEPQLLTINSHISVCRRRLRVLNIGTTRPRSLSFQRWKEKWQLPLMISLQLLLNLPSSSRTWLT